MMTFLKERKCFYRECWAPAWYLLSVLTANGTELPRARTVVTWQWFVKWLVESALIHPHALNYMKGRRPETLTANRGRPRRVGDSKQRLAMDVSGVVAFIRVTEWSCQVQVLRVVCGRRLPCFHHLCTTPGPIICIE
jgi:hypothetical protein